jgi:hypothetical protein
MTNENADSTEKKESEDTSKERALTPLERVRAGQAKMRGQRSGGAPGSQKSGAASPGGAHQRTSYPRKSG